MVFGFLNHQQYGGLLEIMVVGDSPKTHQACETFHGWKTSFVACFQVKCKLLVFGCFWVVGAGTGSTSVDSGGLLTRKNGSSL